MTTVPLAIAELSELLKSQTIVVNSHVLVPVLRQAIAAVRAARPTTGTNFYTRLVGEVYGLLISLPDGAASTHVQLLLVSVVRDLCLNGKLPVFVSPRLTSLGPVLSLVRELYHSDDSFTSSSFESLAAVVSDGGPAGPRLEALSTLIHLKSCRLSELDAILATALIGTDCTPATARRSTRTFVTLLSGSPNAMIATELDGSVIPPTSPFSVLVAAGRFSDAQQWHIGVFSSLVAFLQARSGGSTSEELFEGIVANAIRLLTQSQRDISASGFSGKKSFKFVNRDLVPWSKDLVESAMVETLRGLSIVCKESPGKVPIVFPHVRRMYERVLLRPDSPGIAMCETIKFFLTHAHLVIFDIEPVLRYFFGSFLAKLVTDRSVSSQLLTETAIFICDYATVLAGNHGALFASYFPAILRVAAWSPRAAGTELTAVMGEILKSGDSEDFFSDFFHSILDLPLIAAISELTLSVDDYIEKRSLDASDGLGGHEDQFTQARIAMRLVRSAEFRDIQEYLSRPHVGVKNVWLHSPAAAALVTELWNGILPTPRIAAATRLVVSYLEIFLAHEKLPTRIFGAILSRFGRSFLFKPEVGTLLIAYVNRSSNAAIMKEFRSEIVTAILHRILQNFGSELIIHLVRMMGIFVDQVDPLFVKLLRYLLTGECGLEPNLEIVYIKNGRILQQPNEQHPLLDSLVSDNVVCPVDAELVCVILSTLTKIAAAFPQYRPQTVHIFATARGSLRPVAQERIDESLVVLHSFHCSRRLVSGA